MCGIILWNVKGHGSRPGLPGRVWIYVQLHRRQRAFIYSLGNDSNRYTRSAYLISELPAIASSIILQVH
uniref:Uncharacterized protein n=1 Tax=Anopheles gambiae TaxID=7165 RepID=A0A453YZU6_ANOGA